MRTRRAFVVAALLTVTPVTVAGVWAQTTEPQPAAERRPFRGIFGAPASAESPHSLFLTGSVFAAYDDNVTEGLSDRRVGAPWLQKPGTYQGANAGLNYTFSLDGERVDLRGGAGAQIQYFRHEDRSGTLPSTQADVALNLRLSSSLTFSVRQSAAYRSTYNAALTMPVDEEGAHVIGAATDPALDLFEWRAVQLATRVNLSQRFGRYASLGASYHLRSTTTLDQESPDSRFHDYTAHTGSIGFLYSRPMTRAATLQLGYGIRVTDGRSRTGEPEIMHNVNAGVNYSRALSFSRRTSVRFGTGSAILVSEPVAGTTEEGGRRTQARLTGHAALVHEIGRTWTADLGYTRGFRTRDGFDQLYFTDAITANLGGLISRRISFTATGTWADSSIGEGRLKGHRGQSASAQLTYGLTRFLALYSTYVYTHYRFDEGIQLDDRFPRQLDRHGVRVGVTTSVPLIR